MPSQEKNTINQFLKYTLKIFIILCALSIASVSWYFGVGFFLWLGLNDFFSCITSIIVVGIMDITSQAAIYYVRQKKFVPFGFILSIWIFFLIVSIGGTVIGMNQMIDSAKKDRIEKAVDEINEDKGILLLDTQIENDQNSITAYQLSYDTESKKEKPNYWLLTQYKTDLENAKSGQALKIEQRQKLIDDKETEAKNNEIMTDAKGKIDPTWKLIISIALGLIIDLSSCLVMLFSWIFDKKDNEVKTIISEPKKEVVPMKHIESVAEIKKPIELSFPEYAALYYDTRVIEGSKLLQGRAASKMIPVVIYDELTTIACKLGYIIKRETKSYIKENLSKQEFIKGILEEKENIEDVF